jgi:hypothetical protein
MRTHAPILDEYQWHRWFAWHPVQCGDTRVWWEWVERKDTSACQAMVGHFWIYRLAAQTTAPT